VLSETVESVIVAVRDQEDDLLAVGRAPFATAQAKRAPLWN
jgi:hypothetical protein